MCGNKELVSFGIIIVLSELNILSKHYRNAGVMLMLTHLCRINFPILINWTSPFPILRLLVGILDFFIHISISKQWRT